ncbi:MAG: I78 family peptidase inhibitor [Gemmobacter sp.]
MPHTPKFALAVALAGLVAACDSADPPVGQAPDTCGASLLQVHVGSDADDLILPETAGPVRIHAEGDPLTMDFNPARLNVETDGQGIVQRIYCG